MGESDPILILYDEGLRYEADDSDCEESEDGTGFYLLADEGEEFEEFYEYCADEGDE